MPAKKKEGPYITPEITLRGRNALVVQEVAALSGRSEAQVAEWMVDEFLSGEEGQKKLATAYKLDVMAYVPAPSVVSIESRKARK